MDPATRPLVPGDSLAVFELTRDAEVHDTGQSLIEPEDITGDWARPSFDLGSQSIGFFDGGRLVAYGEVHKKRAEAYVHPDHRGRGLGTQLLNWSLAKARELGYPRLGQTVPVTNTGAVQLFQSRGFQVLYTSWILELPYDAEIAAAAMPSGHRLRAFDPKRDGRDVFRIFEDAFNEWPNREPSTYEDWAARFFHRADFEPWMLVVAVAGSADDEQIVGAAKLSSFEGVGWVDQIAVRHDVRGRGLGRALLVAAYQTVRAQGASRMRLNTDSRTGALGLYEHVGMQVVETYEHYSLELR